MTAFQKRSNKSPPHGATLFIIWECEIDARADIPQRDGKKKKGGRGECDPAERSTYLPRGDVCRFWWTITTQARMEKMGGIEVPRSITFVTRRTWLSSHFGQCL